MPGRCSRLRSARPWPCSTDPKRAGDQGGLAHLPGAAGLGRHGLSGFWGNRCAGTDRRLRGGGVWRGTGAGSSRDVVTSLMASVAWPSGVSETSPWLLSRTRPSITESSHTESRGQVLRQASMTSARVRGRSATQARNWSMIRRMDSAMGRNLPHSTGAIGCTQKKCPGPHGGRGREPDGGRGIGGLSGTQSTHRTLGRFRPFSKNFRLSLEVV